MSKKLKEFLATLGLTGTAARKLLYDDKGEAFLAADSKHASIVELSAISDAEYLELCRENGMEPDEDPAATEANKTASAEDRAAAKAAWLAKLAAENKGGKVLQKERIKTFRASDETTDRGGDIVRVAGWELGDFKKNPVFLEMHDYRKDPIGRIIKVWKEENDAGAPGGKSLMIHVYFPTKEVSPRSDAALRAIDGKLFGAVSVGFMPSKINNPSDQEERNSLGLGKWGVEFLKQKLWEVSLVTVPANQNALVINGANAEHVELCTKMGVPFIKEGEADPAPAVTPEQLAAVQADIKALQKTCEGFQESLDTIGEACMEILSRIAKPGEDGGSGPGQKDPKAAPAVDFGKLKDTLSGLDFTPKAAA